jgi:hypothetical protein
MRRIIFMLVVSAMVSVVLALSAAPAFAGGNVIYNNHAGQGGHNTNTSSGSDVLCLSSGGQSATNICGNNVTNP